jgi:hypothetical protein
MNSKIVEKLESIGNLLGKEKIAETNRINRMSEILWKSFERRMGGNDCGGFKKPKFIFMKVDGARDTNAVRLQDGVSRLMPDLMPIIEVE